LPLSITISIAKVTWQEIAEQFRNRIRKGMKQSSRKLLHVTVLVTGWRKWGKLWKNIQTLGQELSTGPHWI